MISLKLETRCAPCGGLIPESAIWVQHNRFNQKLLPFAPSSLVRVLSRVTQFAPRRA